MYILYHNCQMKADVLSSQFESIVQEIRSHISEEHGLSLSCICLLQTKSIIKTTSGKISRAGCRKAYLGKTLDVLYTWQGTEKEVDLFASTMQDASARRKAALSAGSASDPSSSSGPSGQKIGRFTAEEIRAMPLPQIVSLLELSLVQVSSQGPSALTASLPQDVSMISLGLDSFTLVQYKTVLEKRFSCEIPDEFLFTNVATLRELSLTVKNGRLTEEQTQRLSSGPSEPVPSVQESKESEGRPGAAAAQGERTRDRKASNRGKQPHSTVIEQKTPLCPWFTCCY